MENKTIKPKKIENNKEGSLRSKTEILIQGSKPEVSQKSLIFVGIIVILIAGYFILNKIGLIQNIKSAGQVETQGEVPIDDQKILAQLKTIILLPDDIAPTMALVTDADKLRSQQPAFFANVKNGDRLIIYPDLAIIYDYQANKIIKIGPVQNAPIQQNN